MMQDSMTADTERDCRAWPVSLMIFSPGSLTPFFVEFTINPRYSISWVGVSSALGWLMYITAVM